MEDIADPTGFSTRMTCLHPNTNGSAKAHKRVWQQEVRKKKLFPFIFLANKAVSSVFDRGPT